MLRKLKRVVIIIIIQWVKKVALILENSWTKFWWTKLFWPSSFLLTLSAFFLGRNRAHQLTLIEVGGSSYMGMFGYLTAFQKMIDQVKLQLFLYCVFILCISGQEVMNAVKHWSQKSLFVKRFFSGYLSKCWLCLFQNVLENFYDIVVTVGSGGSASGIAIGNYLTGSKLKYALNRNIDIFLLTVWEGWTRKYLSQGHNI